MVVAPTYGFVFDSKYCVNLFAFFVEWMSEWMSEWIDECWCWIFSLIVVQIYRSYWVGCGFFDTKSPQYWDIQPIQWLHRREMGTTQKHSQNIFVIYFLTHRLMREMFRLLCVYVRDVFI
jgi:hypothetical protein